jgi:hypothetical protein
MKFTDKFVEIVRKMERIDPKQDSVKLSKEGFMKKPDETLLAEWEKRGLKLGEFEAVNDEKRISARFKVEFASLAALASLEDIQNKGTGFNSGGFRLTRDEKGIYTLAMVSDGGGAKMDAAEEEDGEDDDGDDGAEGEEEEAKEEEKVDPETAARRAQEGMALMGEMMGEAAKLKFTVCIKVPGEIVDFAPETAGKKEEGAVTWTVDFGSMMAMQMQGAMGGEEEEGGKSDFKVRFRMPEGKEIPASALTPAKPKPAPAPPAAPPKAPGGGGDHPR